MFLTFIFVSLCATTETKQQESLSPSIPQHCLKVGPLHFYNRRGGGEIFERLTPTEIYLLKSALQHEGVLPNYGDSMRDNIRKNAHNALANLSQISCNLSDSPEYYLHPLLSTYYTDGRHQEIAVIRYILLAKTSKSGSESYAPVTYLEKNAPITSVATRLFNESSFRCDENKKTIPLERLKTTYSKEEVETLLGISTALTFGARLDFYINQLMQREPKATFNTENIKAAFDALLSTTTKAVIPPPSE